MSAPSSPDRPESHPIGDPGRSAGRIAVVTGAGRGIGRAIAARLAADGAVVVATDLDPAAARDTARVLNEPAGGTAVAPALGLGVDVTDRAAIDAMVAKVRERFGQIDVLVNNAGWDVVGPFVDSDPAVWDRVIGINLYGVLRCCHAVLPVMIAQGSGTVVNLGSDAGRVGSSGEAVYSAAKGGIIAFTKTIARETARHGVNVNCVCPGPTDTELFASVGGDDPALRDALVRAIPFRRLAQPSDVAHAVAFLASPEAGYLTGQTLSVSGGLTMS